MSTDKWWRGPRSSGQLETRDDRTAWPGLSPNRRRPTRREVRSHDDNDIERFRDQARSVDRSTVLDDEGYPKLGERLPKRKLQEPPADCSEGIADLEKLQLDDEVWMSRRVCKKRKRLNVIRIDLEKVLERQRSLSESQTASCPKPRLKLNFKLSIRNPLDSARLIQCHRGIQREVPRAKRITKLKKVILREREYERELNIFKRELFDAEKIQAMTKEVGEIDFNKLKISGEPKPDIKFVRDMSTLNLFDNEHRTPPSDHIPENWPDAGGNDVVRRIESLLICKHEEDDHLPDVQATSSSQLVAQDGVESMIDSSIAAKTSCLRICNETGETVEEFGKPQEPPLTCYKIMEPHNVSDRTPKCSKKFREYCSNDLTPGLNTASENFLAEVYRLQRRMYERDEVKGRCKRRFYAGFKEICKHVESKKIKFVLIAPDIEGIHGYPGGLDELVSKLITACKVREVVFCFALNKRKLGYYTHKKGCVSCVGIANYAGLEENFKNVLTELTAARNSYERRTSPRELGKTLQPDNSDGINEMLLSTRINLLLKNLTVKDSN